jgi:hypothetical protein
MPLAWSRRKNCLLAVRKGSGVDCGFNRPCGQGPPQSTPDPVLVALLGCPRRLIHRRQRLRRPGALGYFRLGTRIVADVEGARL